MACLRGVTLVAILASIPAHAVSHAVQEAGAAVQPIEPGQLLEGALSSGHIARYSASLTAGRAATLVVVHRDVDIVVRLFQTGAEADVEAASDGASGELRLTLHAARSGPWTFEIAAAYPKGSIGTYSLRVDDMREPTVTDRLVADAQLQHTRAIRLRSMHAYVSALSHAEQALASREKALGPHATDVARSVLLLGRLNDDLARFDVADALYVRARAIVERSSDDPELIAAEIGNSQAVNNIARGRLHEAEGFVKDALAIRERILGSHHFLVALSLGTLSDLHNENANLQEAGITANRALEIAVRSYNPTDVRLGDLTNRSARSELLRGNFARADQLYRQTLEVREQSTGPDSLDTADSLGGLARVALLSNENVTAERLHVKVLAIREKIFGPDHPQIVNDLINLGLIHYRRRDYPGALTLYQRAVAIREKTAGRSHPSIALILNNIGLVYWRQSDYARAEDFYRRAFELSEQLYGTESLRVTNSLANLGIVAKETGNYALAESRYQRALAIKEKHLGRDHPDLIATIESLAILYRDRADYQRAEEMFQRVITISVASLGPEHPFVARHLNNVGDLDWAMGRWDEAFAARQRAVAIEERNLPLNLSIGSERQKLAYFEPLLRNLEETISFHVQQPTDHSGWRDLAITTLLQRKGRVLDALADNLGAFRSRSSPEDRTLLDQLARVTSDLAAAVLSGSTQSPVKERQRTAASLAAERERLEIELSRRSSGYLDPSRPLALAAVQAALPSSAALIEFSVYRPFDPRTPIESRTRFGSPRYAAYVIRHEGEPGWRDLGGAEEIDRSVDAFRSALADPARPAIIRLATELQRKLMAPLQPLWGDATHLVISPDGPLNLIPFEALRTGGRYLVEQVEISYVTTGRDLLRMLTPRPSGHRAAVFADPVFGEPSSLQVARTDAAVGSSSRTRRRSIVAGPDLTSVYFAPLAGTATEARRIHALFPEMELRVGAQATEKTMKALQAPRILHVATHGFFLEGGASIDNPLLRSGLALAGANLPRASGDDGILTALEAANLNLWGTKLVTLSACDTGIGVVRNGEGVYGLRRAFFLAGAESLVMSLWPVSDLLTREMMTGYYAGLKEGLGRGAALRRMQLRTLKRAGRSHPFYWASFIQAGEWANLDGRR